MALSAGTKLGPYEIISLIGAGGMGEVYRAKDTRLDRTVAIKTLVPHFSADPDRKKRFEREARTISSLSHANICALYDVGHDNGTDYLVMEYLEGESLADRLQKNPLTTELVLRYSIQIAEALDKAHRQGIVHRDLKPGNIMLTKSGAKLLDFGLAKYDEMNILKVGESELMTLEKPLTEEGVILGTVQYMAPEQLEGKQTDGRTDIFALGEVMYEMVTGQKAFSGQSKASLISSILTSDPKSISTIQPLAPPALDHVVNKCLAKDPDERWQSAHDVASELKWIAEGGSQTGPMSPVVTTKRTRDSKIAWSVAAIAILLLVATIGFTFWRMKMIEPQVNWSGVQLGGPEFAMDPRISPDGRTLAFQAMVSSNTQVAVMKPETGDWQVLTHRSDSGYVQNIAWSPDGNRIYFDRGADVPMGVFSVPVFGGAEQLVVEDAQTPQPLPDGSLLLTKLNAEGTLQLFRFWPDSGRLKAFPLRLTGPGFSQLRLFLDGKEAVVLGRLIGSADQAIHLYAVNPDSGNVRRIATDLSEDMISAIATTPDNASVLAVIRSQDLTRVVRVPRNGGASSFLSLTFTERVGFMDVANDGNLYTDAQDYPRAIMQFPAEGGTSVRIGTITGGGFDSMLPVADGRVLVEQNLASRSRLVALEAGKDPAVIITTNEETGVPVTAVSENEIAFLIGAAPRATIAVASLKSGRVTRRIVFDKGEINSLAASPDGKTIYCSAAGWIWGISESGQLQKICAGQSVAADPDGKSLIVKILQAPKARLLRVPLDGSAPHEITLNGPFHLTFDPVSSAEISHDGRMLAPLASLDDWFFVPGIIDLATGRMSRITTDQTGDYHAMSWMPNGKAAALANEFRSTIWKFTPKSR